MTAIKNVLNTVKTSINGRNILAATAATVFGLAVLTAGFGRAVPPADTKGSVLTARDVVGPAAAVPLKYEPPAKIIVDPPLPDELAHGVAIVQFRTENARIMPVYGLAALAVSPRVAHLHVTVDDNHWHWAHSSSEPMIVAPLPPPDRTRF